MTNVENHIENLQKQRISVIVRTDDESNAWKIISNSLSAGINFIEITLTIPNALHLISKAQNLFPEAVIGAGTVLNISQAKACLKAGAKYFVSPIFNQKLLKWSVKHDLLYIPGVFTPNEMYQAYLGGAKLLKLYPATAIGAEALSLIAKPFPEFKILATGGINIDNLNQYLQAGAIAVGITDKLGGADTSASADSIKKLAQKYIEITNKIRN